MTSKPNMRKSLISQEEVDQLFNIHDLIEQEATSRSLIDEIQEAILDSGRLTLDQWRNLRNKIREIEELVPHMDLIIKLKETDERRRKVLCK